MRCPVCKTDLEPVLVVHDPDGAPVLEAWSREAWGDAEGAALLREAQHREPLE
jgi:hypothetical protein